MRAEQQLKAWFREIDGHKTVLVGHAIAAIISPKVKSTRVNDRLYVLTNINFQQF